MDREILFRGKAMFFDLKWHEGNYWFDEKDNEHLIVHRKYLPIRVHPETVGQYTGLNYEKDRRKMFEGDVFRRGNFLYVIKVDSYNGFRFMVELADGSGLGAVMLTKTDAEYGEYVGNIHDNPELINGVGNG